VLCASKRVALVHAQRLLHILQHYMHENGVIGDCLAADDKRVAAHTVSWLTRVNGCQMVPGNKWQNCMAKPILSTFPTDGSGSWADTWERTMRYIQIACLQWAETDELRQGGRKCPRWARV
jgi:hypothetical protein